MMNSIILASQSPRRKALLQLAEIPFDVIVANTDESYPTNLNNEDIAMYIANQKAATIFAQHNSKIVLAADTIVVCNKAILGKPIDEADAIRILKILSGTSHQVITGVCIMHPKGTISFAETTQVYFNPLTEVQIAYYVNTYKPFDKAGAYAIQEWIGAIGIHKIEGDYYNVMGLPINKIVPILQSIA